MVSLSNVIMKVSPFEHSSSQKAQKALTTSSHHYANVSSNTSSVFKKPLPLSVFPKSLQKIKSKTTKSAKEKTRASKLLSPPCENKSVKMTSRADIKTGQDEAMVTGVIGSDIESVPDSQDPCLISRLSCSHSSRASLPY